tara:strand:+ start:697 stop:2082 length:1386 start_codon:yes stop_codon:yes gene_type:complete
MALFSKADISKSKYIISIVAKINSGDKIKVSGGKSYKFNKTDTIVSLEKVQTKVNQYTKILYAKNTHLAIFTDGTNTFRFIDIDKAPFSGIGNGSRNALGKKLADAGELATVASLLHTVKTPKDTGQQIFIDNPDAFITWFPTFQHTRPAVNKIVGSLNGFEILHDATDKSTFAKAITAFTKKAKIAKDSWNPADIFIINKGKKTLISKELQDLVDRYEIKDGLIPMFNNKLYDFYKNKELYPISLKQLITDKPSIDYTNEPGKIKIAAYNIEIAKFNCNLSAEGKEIGLFTFKNTDTSKQISLQVRGFPHGYGTAQTEITSDGTPSGGRLGKISTAILDRIMAEYDDERISSITYFGRTPNVFSTFDTARINEVYGWYKTVTKHNKVKDQSPLSKSEFKDLITKAQNDYDVAQNLCMKIQGLKIMYFFIENEKNLSSIMNKMINGAKKISVDNGFFIKIY